jgi:hypothetical protein
MKKTVTSDIRSIFNAPNIDESNRLLQINVVIYVTGHVYLLCCCLGL